MYYNKVEISGVNTAKLKVLKESEKTELLRQMHSGDPTAKREADKRQSASCSQRDTAFFRAEEKTPTIFFRSDVSA